MPNRYIDKIKNYFENDRITVIFSFILIFAFSSVDHAISPLIDAIHNYYAIPLEQGLELISACTLGIVIGVFIGPTILRSWKAPLVSTISSSGLMISLLLFLLTHDFDTALALRFVFGLSAGILSSTMWWMAYSGVSARYYHAAIMVLMAARPLAVALGIPFSGIIATSYHWKSAFGVFLFMIMISIAALYKTLPADSDKKINLNLKNIFAEYAEAFRSPNASLFYLGLTINKMCYFGFYSLAGIWFIKYYGLSTLSITIALMYIGFAEAAVNFFIPWLLNWGGHKTVFTYSLFFSCVVFGAIISGVMPFYGAVLLFAVFAMLDRVYSMAMVIALPQLFPDCQNKSTIGSLVTLSAWLALTVVSWLEGTYLEFVGIRCVEIALLIALIAGSFIIYHLINKHVYKATHVESYTPM